MGTTRTRQATMEVMLFQISAGQDVAKDNKKSNKGQKRIAKIRSRYQTGTINLSEYIVAISHNIK